MAGCSQDTANLDIRNLVEKRVLVRSEATGRRMSNAPVLKTEVGQFTHAV